MPGLPILAPLRRSVSFSHTLMDLSLEDEMKTFVLFVSKAFISSILPEWATKDLQKDAQCKILGITGPARVNFSYLTTTETSQNEAS